MTENQKWLADQCLEIIGDKDKSTLEYLKSVAKKAKSVPQLQSALKDFEIPIDNNPRNEHFSVQLYDKFGSRTQAERKEAAILKKKTEYGLVDMNLSANKKLFVKDSEVKDVRNAEMLRNKDARERD